MFSKLNLIVMHQIFICKTYVLLPLRIPSSKPTLRTKNHWLKLISQYYNNFLISHFEVNKIKEQIGQKYYQPSLSKDVKAYVKNCVVYVFGIKSGRTQVLQKLLISINTNTLLGRLLNGVCDIVSSINQLLIKSQSKQPAKQKFFNIQKCKYYSFLSSINSN